MECRAAGKELTEEDGQAPPLQREIIQVHGYVLGGIKQAAAQKSRGKGLGV